MAKRTLQENINQVINDLNEIKSAIELKGVEVPAGTPTRDYSDKILNIETGVDVSADTVVAAALRAGFTAHEASGAAITGIIQNYEGAIVSGATPGAQAKYEEGYADGQASMPDLSKDTVTPDKLVLGETAHDASGVQITGTLDTEAIRAEGIEAGKKSEYDAFWDAYQQNGKRTNYQRSFSGLGWTAQNFRPKYNMKPTDCSNMFAVSGMENQDLRGLLDAAGVTLDTSECMNFSYMFQYNAPTHIPMLDTRACNNLAFLSNNGGIDDVKFILRDDGSQQVANMLYYNSNLKTLEIEGTIGQNGFDVKWSPLNKASLTSVVNALSSTTTGLTVTLRLAAVNTAFETTAGAADGSTSEEWTALIATKPNWTINLINS